jgi:hypothetical protein
MPETSAVYAPGGGVTLVSADAPQTERTLVAAGVVTRRLDVSELHKAEAGLTCLSLLCTDD